MELSEKELIDIEKQLLKTITGNGLAISRFMEWIKSINSEKSEDEKVCDPHHTISIRWAHKCVDCGKIFEGQ